MGTSDDWTAVWYEYDDVSLELEAAGGLRSPQLFNIGLVC